MSEMPTEADIAALREEVRAAPKLMTYLKAGRALDALDLPARRVRILSSFTVRTLAPYLKAEALLSGWRADPAFEEYTQWQRALLEAPQEGDEADAYVLLLHPEAFGDSGRDRDSALDAAADELAGLIAGFRKRCAVPLLIVLPQVASRGERFGFGLQGRGPAEAAARRLAQALEEVAAETSGIYCVAPPHAAVPARDIAGLYQTMTPIGADTAPAYAELIARSLAGFFRPRRKVLVCDLDNTLWGGVVGETGASRVALGPDWPGQAYRLLQRAILDLADSGILLAIASKNNEADARDVFETRDEMVLRWDDFVARRIDWNDKAENIRAMAADLSLGLDSFVFLDDSPVECERVRTALPQVAVVQMPEAPERFVETLMDCRGFDALTVVAEDKLRSDTYKAEGKREALKQDARDLDAFLKSLALEADLKPVADATIERTHQLFNKTNQFHMTLDRPTLRDVEARRDRLFTLSLRDKFGDYGIIGVVEIVPADGAVRIENLVMSCRALGRGMEETAVAFAAEQARATGADRVEIAFAEGPRNQPSRAFLDRAGFVCAGDGAATQTFVLEIGPDVPAYPEAVTLHGPAEANR